MVFGMLALLAPAAAAEALDGWPRFRAQGRVAMLLGVLMLGEAVTWTLLAGLALVIAGILVANLRGERAPAARAPMAAQAD
jgi:drug/metabolite transporter (DMT)-like permease